MILYWTFKRRTIVRICTTGLWRMCSCCECAVSTGKSCSVSTAFGFLCHYLNTSKFKNRVWWKLNIKCQKVKRKEEKENSHRKVWGTTVRYGEQQCVIKSKCNRKHTDKNKYVKLPRTERATFVSTVFHHIGEHVHEHETTKYSWGFLWVGIWTKVSDKEKCWPDEGTPWNVRGSQQVSEILPLGFTDICTKCHANPTQRQPSRSLEDNKKVRKISKVRRIYILVTRKCKKFTHTGSVF